MFFSKIAMGKSSFPIFFYRMEVVIFTRVNPVFREIIGSKPITMEVMIMKKRFMLIPALVLVMVIAAGCRSKANNGNTPSTTTAPTTMPTTVTTEPTSAPTQAPSTQATVDNGNGPLESNGAAESTDSTGSTNGTAAGEETQGARNRSANPGTGGTGIGGTNGNAW